MGDAQSKTSPPLEPPPPAGSSELPADPPALSKLFWRQWCDLPLCSPAGEEGESRVGFQVAQVGPEGVDQAASRLCTLPLPEESPMVKSVGV